MAHSPAGDTAVTTSSIAKQLIKLLLPFLVQFVHVFQVIPSFSRRALAGVALAVSELCRLEPTVQLDHFDVASEYGIQLFVFPLTAERVIFVLDIDIIVPEHLQLVES